MDANAYHPMKSHGTHGEDDVSLGSGNSHSVVSGGDGHSTAVKPEFSTMNASGLMRLYINGDNKVYKIHCVRVPIT